MPKQAIIIATGNEILQGECLNTTTHAIADKLNDYHIQVIAHHTVPDDHTTITTCIQTALDQADIVFVTGGLGPTSDDCTRESVADATNKPLIWHQPSWDALCARLTQYGHEVAATNKQQAYLPTDSEPLPNAEGTAPGCWLKTNDWELIMLPGPPNECLSMLDQSVWPRFTHHQEAQCKQYYTLMGIGESTLAETLEPILAPLPITLGYRAHYPSLVLKLFATEQNILQQAITLTQPLIAPYIVNETGLDIVKTCQALLISHHKTITIYDGATYGGIQQALTQPSTGALLSFVSSSDLADISFSGLDAYWQLADFDTPTHITCDNNHSFDYPNLNPRIHKHAVHWACWQLCQWIRAHHS